MAFLDNDVLPFNPPRALSVQARLPAGSRELSNSDAHPYELYLVLHEIEYRRTEVRRPQTNGFVERFHRTLPNEFFRVTFRTTFCKSVDLLQHDLDAWLVHYNTERPHQGCRNLGRRPLDTIRAYLADPSAVSLKGGVAVDAVPQASTVRHEI